MITDYVGSTYVGEFNKFGLSLQIYVQADANFRLQPDDLLNLNVRSQNGSMVPLCSSLVTLAPIAGPSIVTLYNLYPSATVLGSPGRASARARRWPPWRRPPGRSFPTTWARQLDHDVLPGKDLRATFSMSGSPCRCSWSTWCSPGSTRAGCCRSPSSRRCRSRSSAPHRALTGRRGQQPLRADRPYAADRPVGQERHPDRRGGPRGTHEGPRRSSTPPRAAAKTRFRPILMTSFAFILGVLPLVFATGAGANSRRSLGLSVFSGMIASTCLAVVFVPAFFVVLQGSTSAGRGHPPPSRRRRPRRSPRCCEPDRPRRAPHRRARPSAGLCTGQ